jgi:hypothetical protein
VMGQCECTGVYAGEDCSQFTLWFILSVVFLTVIAVSFTTWTTLRIIKYREKLARRKRRAIKKKPTNVDEPGPAAGNVIKRRAFQRQEIRKYMETGPTEEEIIAHKQKQLQSRTIGDSADEPTDVSNPFVAPALPPPVTMRPNIRSALNGLDFNANATDSEEDIDKDVARGPRVPLEPNIRPRVPQLSVQEVAPPAPTTLPVSQFIRAAKGGKLSDRNLATDTQGPTPPRTTGVRSIKNRIYPPLTLFCRFKYPGFLRLILMTRKMNPILVICEMTRVLTIDTQVMYIYCNVLIYITYI